MTSWQSFAEGAKGLEPGQYVTLYLPDTARRGVMQEFLRAVEWAKANISPAQWDLERDVMMRNWALAVWREEP